LHDDQLLLHHGHQYNKPKFRHLFLFFNFKNKPTRIDLYKQERSHHHHNPHSHQDSILYKGQEAS
jgi:hypothetical protein